MADNDILVNFLAKLKSDPDSILFADTIAAIESTYHFTPTAFDNGDIHNNADQNNGSCKLLAFGQLQQLSESELLHCFGEIYRDEVLAQPEADNHGNIRAFMQTGWAGVSFDTPPLEKRA